MDTRQLIELRNKVERLRRDADKASGAYDTTMKSLKVEFGCEDLEEAKTLLDKEQEKAEKLEREFSKALKDFNEKWEGKL